MEEAELEAPALDVALAEAPVFEVAVPLFLVVAPVEPVGTINMLFIGTALGTAVPRYDF